MLGKFEAAESLENCAIRFRKGALDVVKSSKVFVFRYISHSYRMGVVFILRVEILLSFHFFH
jgi:hypothetical protein